MIVASLASVIFGLNPVNISTRCTGPYEYVPDAAPHSGAGLLFQLRNVLLAGIDLVRVLFERQEATPVVFTVAQRRQARVGARCEHRQPAGREVGGGFAVEVGDVERRPEVVRRFKERSAANGTRSESRSLNASSPSGSRPRVERSLATAYGAPLTVTVPLTGPWTVSLKNTSCAGSPGPAPSCPASKCRHRDAFAVVDVVGRAARRRSFFAFVGVAQLLEELLVVLAVGARQAPGEVATAADEHVRRDRRDDALASMPGPCRSPCITISG